MRHVMDRCRSGQLKHYEWKTSIPHLLYWLLVRNRWGTLYVYPLLFYSSWSQLLPWFLFSLVSSCLFRWGGGRQQQHSLKAFSLNAGQRQCHLAFVRVRCLPCCVASATSVHPIACAMTAPNPAEFGLCRHGGKRGLLPRKPESTVKRGNSPEKDPPSSKYPSFFSTLSLHLNIHSSLPRSLSLSLSLSLTHILTLSIYLYIHLFTFLFKIFVYKCVYKLKIISSCPVSKWHLQGKGCVGLRFLIALACKEAAPNTDYMCVRPILSWLSLRCESVWVFSFSGEHGWWSWSLSDGQYKYIVCMSTHAYHTEMY